MEELIKKIRESYNKKTKELEEEKEELLRKAMILAKYKKRAPRNKKELDELFSVTCFGNIGYCCGLEKPCVWRNGVLNILRIPREDYKRKKEIFGYNLATHFLKSLDSTKLKK